MCGDGLLVVARELGVESARQFMRASAARQTKGALIMRVSLDWLAPKFWIPNGNANLESFFEASASKAGLENGLGIHH